MVSAKSSTPDEQLVEAALAGDDDAFAELARRHKSRVFGVAARFARDAAELEDICQDVFIQAYFKLRQYRRDSPFEHWVLRITTHKCYDYLRKRRRSRTTSPSMPCSNRAMSRRAGGSRSAPGSGAPSRRPGPIIAQGTARHHPARTRGPKRPGNRRPHRMEHRQRQSPRLSRPSRPAQTHGEQRNE